MLHYTDVGRTYGRRGRIRRRILALRRSIPPFSFSMKLLANATYLAIALHFARKIIRRAAPECFGKTCRYAVVVTGMSHQTNLVVASFDNTASAYEFLEVLSNEGWCDDNAIIDTKTGETVNPGDANPNFRALPIYSLFSPEATSSFATTTGRSELISLARSHGQSSYTIQFSGLPGIPLSR